MDQFDTHQGLPPELLEALRTMEDGGLLYAVETLGSALIPCWIVRSPLDTETLAQTRISQSLQLVSYDVAPLVVFHLALYDQPQPFRLECFLNPTQVNDRLMLQALSSSSIQKIEYYWTDAAMSWQATKRYSQSPQQQEAARAILDATEGMTCSEAAFLTARDRFLQENPL